MTLTFGLDSHDHISFSLVDFVVVPVKTISIRPIFSEFPLTNLFLSFQHTYSMMLPCRSRSHFVPIMIMWVNVSNLTVYNQYFSKLINLVVKESQTVLIFF